MAMQFSGNLQDVSIIDVVQIIGMTGKSGALRVDHGGQSVEVVFQRGRIASARLSPTQGYMTSLLIQRGQLSFEALHRALGQQREEVERRPIGAILIELGAITVGQLQDALRSYIQSIINLVASWSEGEFSFQLGAHRSGDSIGFLPSDLSLGMDISPQELLLEAARIHDERDHLRTATPGTPSEEDESLARLGGEPDDPTRRPLVLLVTTDLLLQHGLEAKLRDQSRLTCFSSVTPVEGYLRTLRGRCAPAPTLLLDLDLALPLAPGDPSTLEAVPRWREQCPGLTVTTTGLQADPRLYGLLVSGEVRAHLPKPTLEVAAALEVMIQYVDALAAGLLSRSPSDAPSSGSEGAGMVSLYQAILELRRSDHSMTVSLEVLRYVARAMERAVLFAVQAGEIVALGVFGVKGMEEKQWPMTTAKYRQRVAAGSAVDAVIRDMVLRRCVPASRDEMVRQLHEFIGGPARDEAVLFPLVVANRTFALIYADNGGRDQAFGDCEQLGIMAEHGSLHLENLFLRRQRRAPLAAAPRSPGGDEPPAGAVPVGVADVSRG